MKVLFVDDEEHLRIAAEQTFDLAGIDAEFCADAQEAINVLDAGFEGVVVSDFRMPGMDGMELLQEVKKRDTDMPLILLTGHGDVELAVNVMKEGAYDFLEKPCDPARLTATVTRAFEMYTLTSENRALRSQLTTSKTLHTRLSGRSAAMEELRRQVAAVALTDADVLVQGATGTGKEVCARAIHRASERAQKPFVQINCAALPEAMMENELFGSEAGAFTGAMRTRVGRLEHARGGILCLDEIDSMPLNLQAKLLDVLHNRQMTRLGSNDVISLDFRVITLAKTNLEKAVEQGKFRADLLYRLNVMSIEIPTLTERREDIPGLFTIFTREAADRYKTAHPVITASHLSRLSTKGWPGNLRELRNEAERFVLGVNADIPKDTPQNLATQMADHEKALISAAISANNGRLKETYESLGLSRKTLYDKMQKHGLTKADFVERD